MTKPEFSEIRIAKDADEDALVELLEQMHGESGFGQLDPQRVRAAVRAGIARQGGIVGVVRGDAEVEATIGLFIGSSWYSRDPHLFDLWLYVGEPYRKSPHAKSLIMFAKQAALDLALPLVMTVISNQQTARKELLFERQIPKAGSLFLWNAPAPTAVP